VCVCVCVYVYVYVHTHTGISMELQDAILGLWVNKTSHDGLNAVLFGSRGQDAFLRGR